MWGTSDRTSAHTARRRFFSVGRRSDVSRSLKCKECGTSYALEARYVCERCFGPLEVAYDHSDLDAEPRRAGRSRPGSQSIWRYADFLPFEGRPARPARARADAAGPRRPAGRAPRPARGVDQERRRQPDALVQGPRRLGRASPRPASSASRPSPAPRPATSPTRSPPTPPPPGSSPTSSSPPTSRSRRCSRPASTGPTWSASAATTTTSTGSAPSSAERDPGRSSTSTCARTTPRARRRSPTRSPSSSAGSCPTASSRRSPPARCSRRSPAASQEWLELGLVEGELPIFNGAQAARLLAGRHRVRRGPGRLQPAAPGHDRQVAGDRQPGRRALRARARAPHRRRDRLGHRRRDPRRHPAAGRDDRHLHRDRRRRDDGGARASSPSAARSTPTSASSSTSPARA